MNFVTPVSYTHLDVYKRQLSPSELLNTAAGIALLSQQAPAVALDGNARHVRSAINEASPATRPSPIAVANYLDRLAAGDDPLEALPLSLIHI